MSNQGRDGDFDLSQFYGVFFEEARENLTNYEALLLAIDVAHASDDELNAIFRVAHSIKGGAATFGFADVTELTHELETLLDRLRRRELQLRPAMVDALIEAGDALAAQLAVHQCSSGQAPDTDELVARIKRLAAGRDLTPAAAAAAAEVLPEGHRVLQLRVGPLARAADADGIAELFRDIATLGSLSAIDDGTLSADGYRRFEVVTASPESELIELFSFHLAREQVHFTAEAPLGDDRSTAKKAIGAVPIEGDGYGFFVDPTSLPHGARPAAAGPVDAVRPERRARPDRRVAQGNIESSTLRVSIDKVDQLINLVGELVITQAMLAQQAKDFDPVGHRMLLSGVADLERNTRHLQEAVMSIRMIPMSFVFSRFPRVIRDLAGRLGKQIELKTAGEATELDKGLIEKIVDPLTHLIRNSADHGIEAPEKRKAAGKPAHGTITLTAAHQGGSILIEVKDDGAGLHRDRILRKAVERGLAVREDMADAEVWALIWEPGFSTAEHLSDVSGRGVGMDVVRRNIVALGGTVELDSAAGYGTRVSVRLPLTLAIMDGMSVAVGGESYILPLASVVESLHVSAGMVQTIGSTGRVVKVRDEFMPVAALQDVFEVPPAQEHDATQVLVVLEADGGRIAVIVDQLLGQQQVVVKNLEANYRRVLNISGATILGDGRVALIVDVAALLRRARH